MTRRIKGNHTTVDFQKQSPSIMRSLIMDHIQKRFKEDEDVYVESLIHNVSWEVQSDVKHHICFKKNSLFNSINLWEKCSYTSPELQNSRGFIIGIISPEFLFQSIQCAFGMDYFCQLILLLSLFLLLFMSLTAPFDIIYGSHCTILVNFYFYLQYFQEKIFNFSKISGFQMDTYSLNFVHKPN